MTDTGLPAESQFRGRPPATLETILTVVAVALAALLVALAAWWGWAAYSAGQTGTLSTPAMRALESIKAAVALKPRDAALRVRLGEAMATVGVLDEATGQFKEALQIDPKHTGAWLDLGIIAMQQGHSDEAVAYFKKVVELTEGTDMEVINDRREQALFYLGQVAVEQRRFDEALRYLKGALLIRRDASDTYLLLAQAYKGIGATQKAIDSYGIALTFDPNYAMAHYELGMLLKTKGDLLNSAKNLRAAITAQPGADPPLEAIASFGPVETYVAAAKKDLAAGNAKAAKKNAEIALAVAPDDVPAALLYGSILEKLGDKKAALAVYQQLLQTNPGDKTATAAVARLSAKSGK
jgi:tetratricopeptide (TPR) repeat protein